jgi:hypothetical protein
VSDRRLGQQQRGKVGDAIDGNGGTLELCGRPDRAGMPDRGLSSDHDESGSLLRVRYLRHDLVDMAKRRQRLAGHHNISASRCQRSTLVAP